MAAAYRVAIFTRGTGAFAYTYRGPDGLAAGQVVAVSFRGRLEFGVVAGIDDSHKGELVSLCIVEAQCGEGWGGLLLGLCHLAVANADDIIGHLAFAAGSQAISATLLIDEPGQLPSSLRSGLPKLAGKLTPAARKKLARLKWDDVCASVEAGAARIRLALTGQPGSTRARPDWRKLYLLKPEEAKWLGLTLKHETVVPGSYLAGFSGDVDKDRLTRIRRREVEQVPQSKPVDTATQPALNWEQVMPDPDWEIVRRGFLASGVSFRRCQGSWPAMRAAGGIAAELAAAIRSGEKLLVIAPQEWMLDRLWPGLLACARSITRYRSGLSPGAVAHILGQLEGTGGHGVLGGPSAWKLAAYARFDRVIVIDPTHPQYTAETFPHLDPRSALLLCQRTGQVDLLELGMSLFDGAVAMPRLTIYPQYSESSGVDPPAARRDLNPLPLELRQTGTRRLIYFNRLGSSRGFVCMECHAAVGCPACGSSQLRFSAAEGTYT
ncbi:MAG TPA: hypothetical protein ENO21_02285, partial [Firmicutes bacterium]|nr:hypothetical protein [Bacillota bacterium]